MKEKNISDIKYMLDGENLIHDSGKEYKLFLRLAANAFRGEHPVEEFKESTQTVVEHGFVNITPTRIVE